ncbi:MAG: T9SS type A sorting domain-containing protein, partial [Bacteroidota bacterium]|nr:T9SS type A sorting domain-containing protein [Bacteroidota bacterium]
SLTIGQWYYISVDNHSSTSYKGTFSLSLANVLDYDWKDGAKDITDSIINNAGVWSSADAIYTTADGTQDEARGSCWNTGPNFNKWFKFKALFDTVTVEVKVAGSEGTMRYPYVALWNSSLSQLSCQRYSSSTSDLSITYNNLTVGDWYFISVDNYNSTSYIGTFTLCVDNESNIKNYYSNSNGNWSSNSTWLNSDNPGTTISSWDTVFISHTVTLNQNIDNIHGVLKVESGASLSGTNDIKVGFNGTFLVNASVTINELEINDGTLTNSADIILNDKFIIDGDITLNISDDITTDDLDVKNDAVFTVDNYITINDDITLSNDAEIKFDEDFINQGILSIASGCKLTANEDFTNNGTITNSGSIIFKKEFTNNSSKTFTNNSSLLLISNASGYSSLINNGTMNGSGESQFQLYLSGGDWHYISPPISNDSTNSLWGAAVYSYNEFTDSWQAHLRDEPLQSMKGYDVYYSSNTTVTFHGTFGSGSYSNSYLTYNNGGYNFVANPYPSTIDWDASSGWTKTYLDNAVYIWDPVSQNISTYIDGVSTNGGSRYIPPMQGFFVKCSTSGVNGTLGMTDAVRLHNSLASFRNENSSNVVKLKVESPNGLSDEVVVRFDNNSTKYFDGDFDAFKMRSYNFAVPQIYTKSEDAEELSINTLPEFSNEITIPLYSEFGFSGKYDIFIDKDQFTYSDIIYLEDLKENTIHDFDKGKYSFNANVNDNTKRFILHFIIKQKINDITSVDDENANNIKVFSYENNVFINLEKLEKSTISIYDICGKEIVSKQSEKGINKIVLDVKSGYYIVRVQSGDKNYSEKIFIK